MRKFLSFTHPDLGDLTDVSPRAAHILLNRPMNQLQRFNKVLRNLNIGESVEFQGVVFTIVSHRYHNKYYHANTGS